MNTYSKSKTDLSIEQNKKIKKIGDIIDNKKLVDYILGKRLRPPSPQGNDEKIEMPIPSYFGINRDKAENKYLGLHSKSSFINKGDNISNFIASGRNQNISNINTSSPEQENLEDKNNINNMYNFAMRNDVDLNYVNKYYNNNNIINNNKGNNNTVKSTFGTNIQNDLSLGGMVNTSQNLDNISIFIPLNKDRENINYYNEKKTQPVYINEKRIRDKEMESMFKDLDKIYELTNKIDVSSKARNISEKFDEDIYKIKNKEKISNKYPEPEQNNNLEESNNLNNTMMNNDKIPEESSKYSKTSSKKEKSKSSHKESNKEDEENLTNNNKLSGKGSSNSKKTDEIEEENNKSNTINNRKNSKESYLTSELKSENEEHSNKEEEKGENDKPEEKEEKEHIFEDNNNEKINDNNSEINHNEMEPYSKDDKNNEDNNNNDNKNINEENNKEKESNILNLHTNSNENNQDKEPEKENIEINKKQKTEGSDEEEEEEEDD